jgi:hypothetical protein
MKTVAIYAISQFDDGNLGWTKAVPDEDGTPQLVSAYPLAELENVLMRALAHVQRELTVGRLIHAQEERAMVRKIQSEGGIRLS